MYTGAADGVIYQIDPESGVKKKFARTNGRPLGLKFDKTGNLIVADAEFGKKIFFIVFFFFFFFYSFFFFTFFLF